MLKKEDPQPENITTIYGDQTHPTMSLNTESNLENSVSFYFRSSKKFFGNNGLGNIKGGILASK
jgi:hypothetical protein